MANPGVLGGAGHAFGSLERSAVLANIIVFFLLMLYGLFYVSESASTAQNKAWKDRVRYCVTLNIYIALISLLMNLFAVTTRLDPEAQEFFRTYIHVCRPFEWMLTCPFMMLQIVILGGPQVKAKRRLEIMGVTNIILLLGFFATLLDEPLIKAVLFLCGAGGFVGLTMHLSAIIKEHTGGEATLFGFDQTKDGKTPVLKKLCLKVLATWIGFPIWWSLSPDGFSVITDKDLHQGVFLLLNIVSKMVFVVVVLRLED